MRFSMRFSLLFRLFSASSTCLNFLLSSTSCLVSACFHFLCQIDRSCFSFVRSKIVLTPAVLLLLSAASVPPIPTSCRHRHRHPQKSNGGTGGVLQTRQHPGPPAARQQQQQHARSRPASRAPGLRFSLANNGRRCRHRHVRGLRGRRPGLEDGGWGWIGGLVEGWTGQGQRK